MAESSMELLDLSVTIDGKEIKLKVSRDIYQKAIQEDQATLDLICASVGETTSKQEYSQDLSNVDNQKDGQARGNKEKVCACKGIRTCVLCESIGKESVVPVKLSKVLVDEEYQDDSTFQQLNAVDDDGDIYIATHQPAGEFDFNQGMARLEMAAEQGLESLKAAVLSENLLLSNHELDDLPEELPLDIASMKDDIAAYLLEKYYDIQYGTPIKTTADGDCLFNAVSILLFGDESKALELRYRTLIVMINDEDSLLDLADTSSIMLLSPDINEAILECAKLGGFSSIWTMIALSKLIDRPIQSIYPYINGKEDLAYKILNQTFNKEADGYKLPIMWSTTNLPKDVGSNKKTWVPNHFVAVLPSCQESHVIDDAEFVPKYSKSPLASNPVTVTEGLQEVPMENGSNSDGIKSEVNPDALNDVEPMDTESDLMSGVKRASAEGPCRGKLDKFFNLKQLLDVFKLEGTGLPSVPRGIKENMFFVVDNTLNVDDMKFRSHCEFTDDCGEWEKGSCPSTYLLPVEDSNEYVTLRKKEGKFGVELGKGGFQEIQPQPCYGDLLVISRYYKRLKTSSSYRRRVAWVANVPDSVLDVNPKVAVYEYMGDVPYQLLHNNRKTADKDKPNTKKKLSELQNKVIDNADGESNIDSAREINDEEQSEKEPSEVCDSSSVNSNIHCVTVDAPCRGKLNKFLGMKQLLDVFKCHKTGLPTVPRGVKDNMYFVVNTTKKLERFQKSERFMYNDDCGSWGKGTSPTAYLLPSEGPEEYERLTKRNHIFCIEMPNKEYMEVKPQPKLEDLIIEDVTVYSYCYHCKKAWSTTSGLHPQHSGSSIDFPGIFIQENFVSEAEESSILSDIYKTPFVDSQSGRRKQDFGPKVNFKRKKLKTSNFTGLPPFSKDLLTRMQTHEILQDFLPVEQCHLEYMPERGSAIDPHFDDFWVWGERLVTINLLSDTELCFTIDSKPDVEVHVPMNRRSLLVVYGEARTLWKHAIHRNDIKDKRIAVTLRELSEEFSKNGPRETEGKSLLDIALTFNGVPVA